MVIKCLQDVPEGSLTSSELLKRYGELTEDGKVEIFRMTSVMQEEYGDSTLNPKASHVDIYDLYGVEICGLAKYIKSDDTPSYLKLSVGENFTNVNLEPLKVEVDRVFGKLEKQKQKKSVPEYVLKNNVKVMAVKESVRILMNAQCGTIFQRMPWKGMIKAEVYAQTSPGDELLLSKYIIVENWPLQTCEAREVVKPISLAAFEGLLSQTDCPIKFTPIINYCI
ncbi:hypothetical protein HPULCUR_003022 [Helicostylum pulchrum]|uniref:Uncharacterized protein n=1 Tax=Helicostylum pulchrum TaxID=562976 RepID=A0ABP9XS67_9FUNG